MPLTGSKITFNSDKFFSNLREELKKSYVEYAKEVVPVKTGELKESIKGEVIDKSVIISTDVPYADHVEFGTENSSAQPFMRPALNRTEEFIKKILK